MFDVLFVRLRSVLAALFAVLFFSCLPKNEVIDSSAPSGRFSTDIKPIFDRNCNSSDCHGGTPHGYAGGMNLTTYKGVFDGSRFGTVVVSESPFMSHLVQTINRFDTTLSPVSSVGMPSSRDPLPAQDVEKIVQWIRDGAPDDDGSLPFPDPRPEGKVFFTSQYTDLVGVLDIRTRLIMRYVTVGNPLPPTGVLQVPHNVAVDDQGKYFYVTLLNANKVRKYDVATYRLVAEASAGLSPAHVVITADGSKAYVTNFDSQGRIYVLNTATMTVRKILSAPLSMRQLHGERLSHDGQYLYTADTGSDMMSVIETSTDSIVAHVPLAPDVPVPVGSNVYQPYQVAVRGDDRFIYVTLYNRGFVSVIERTAQGFVFRELVPVGRNPIQLEVTRNGQYVYVCNSGSGSVSIIDAQANTPFAVIDSVGKQPHGIDITEDDRYAFVTCENRIAGDPPHHPLAGSTSPGFLAIIDLARNTVLQRIEVGGYTAGVAITPGRGN